MHLSWRKNSANIAGSVCSSLRELHRAGLWESSGKTEAAVLAMQGNDESNHLGGNHQFQFDFFAF